jgi:hypothetical protein
MLKEKHTDIPIPYTIEQKVKEIEERIREDWNN